MTIKRFITDSCPDCSYKETCIKNNAFCDDMKSVILKEMIEECSGFYRVFEHLKHIAFLKTDIQDIGYERFCRNEQFFSPCVVCGIFAAELALKALLFERDGEFPKGHNIQELYMLLPTEVKRIFHEKLVRGKKLEHLSVDEEIERLKNHFINWCYSYEFPKGLQADIFVETFIETVCDYVLNTRYDNDI